MPNHFGEASHGALLAWLRTFSSIRRSRRAVRSGGEDVNSAKVGGDSARARQSKSSGGNPSCDNRNASRNNRFQRFRSTAPPTRRDTTSPKRGCARPLAAPYSKIEASAADDRA